MQVVYGLNVQFVKDAMEDIINDRTERIDEELAGTAVTHELTAQVAGTSRSGLDRGDGAGVAGDAGR